MLLLVFIVAELVQHSYVMALDASWLPSDPDGPLPLKASYRTALRQLCNRLKEGKPMPPSIEAQRSIIENQCAKLAQSDASYGFSEWDFSLSLSSLSPSALLSRLKLSELETAGLVRYVVAATIIGATVWYLRRPCGLVLGATDRGARGGMGDGGGDGPGASGSGWGRNGMTQEELREARLRHLLNNPTKGYN